MNFQKDPILPRYGTKPFKNENDETAFFGWIPLLLLLSTINIWTVPKSELTTSLVSSHWNFKKLKFAGKLPLVNVLRLLPSLVLNSLTVFPSEDVVASISPLLDNATQVI